MTIVVDASVIAAALIQDDQIGDWALQLLADHQLIAPQLLLPEVAIVIRRLINNKRISNDVGALAHAELLQLRIGLYDYRPLAGRVWELRNTLTTYDAWYVALAESFDLSLATLDRRMMKANGPRCDFVTAPAS